MSNWLATAANMAVGFFLAPFIVHRLGNIAYGVWILAMSSVGYLGLLDLGMRSSVLRFVSKGRTQNDHGAASDAVSAALWLRGQIGVAVLLISAGLAAVFPYVFHIPPELARDARIAVMLIGFKMSLYMTVGVFGGVLSGLNRYDLLTAQTLTELAIRATGVVVVLRSGHGIIAIAICECAASIAGNLLLLAMTRRVYPELRVRLLAKPDMQVLRQLWSYSVYAFLVSVAVQLVYQTDNLVVGAFVSTAAVTFYSIGNSLCRYTDQVVGAMTLTFVPAASTFEASGDTAKLLGLYRHGTRAMMAVSLPILVTLMTRGRTFIGLWMGPQFMHVSGTVLMILAAAQFFSLTNLTGGAIAFGVEKHRMLAQWSIVEGVTNLTLSILLAMRFGIFGVAIGTMIPSLFIHLYVWPFVFTKRLNLGGPRAVWAVWGPMFMAAIPFTLASYAVNRFYPPRNLLAFLAQTFALLPVFFLPVAIVFRDYLQEQMMPHVRARFPALIK
ncbi:MAG: oligosaccharide flippase family protein [Acidobacteriaceae bacterium]|nr:oligosaccharide flippase family protein [Acidobacteriaceae bacterium]